VRHAWRGESDWRKKKTRPLPAPTTKGSRAKSSLSLLPLSYRATLLILELIAAQFNQLSDEIWGNLGFELINHFLI